MCRHTVCKCMHTNDHTTLTNPVSFVVMCSFLVMVMSFQLVELALLVKKDMEEVIFDQMADSSVGASHDLVPPSPIPPISSEKIGK